MHSSLLLSRHKWHTAVVLSALTVLVLGWLNLELENHFLLGVNGDERVKEINNSAPPPLYSFVWRSPVRTTWGEVARDLGLDDDLIVESYKCTTSDVLKTSFDDLRNKEITKDQNLIVVLRKGQCVHDS